MANIQPQKPKNVQAPDVSKTESTKAENPSPSNTVARAKRKVKDFLKVSKQSLLNREVEIGTKKAT